MAAKKKKAAAKKNLPQKKLVIKKQPASENRRGPGRPPKFEVSGKGVLDRIEKLAGLGLTNEQIALCLDIAPSTLYNYMATDATFKEAIERGKAKAVAAVANALMAEALRGNVAAHKFFLTNRDRNNWKDRQDLTHDIGKETMDAVASFRKALDNQ